MAKIVITIETDNAAFEDNEAGEVARILCEYAKKTEDRGMVEGGFLYDFNGNKVGKAEWKS